MINAKVVVDKASLRVFCQQWGISELGLFGSALRETFSTESDIDLLVTFKDQSHPTLFDLVRMEKELSELFHRPVDLISRRGIERSANYLRRSEILSTVQSLYADAA